MKLNTKLIEADRRKRVSYILARIPTEGTRIYLWPGNAESRAVYADVKPLGDEVLFETNHPGFIGLEEVYDHLREQEGTFEELWKQETSIDPRFEYDRKVAALSSNERKLFDAASEGEPLRGEELAFRAGLEYDGQTKSRLSMLVKFRLLGKVTGGYRRENRPRLLYEC